MNRKSFIRNLLGATVAVTIGKHLPVPTVESGWPSGVTEDGFPMKFDSNSKWMEHQMYLAQMAHLEQMEKAYWAGSYNVTTNSK